MVDPETVYRRGGTVVLALFALAWFGPAAYAQDPPVSPFTSLVNTMEQVTLGSTGLADVDNDGDFDVLVAGVTERGPAAVVYRFDRYVLIPQPNASPLVGLETGLSYTLAGVGGAYSLSAWSDVNRDGFLDLYVSGSTTSSAPYTPLAQFFINTGLDGDRFRTVRLPEVTPTYGGSAAWGDYDNDGDADLLVTGLTGSGAYVTLLYRNDSTPSGAIGDPNNLRFTDVATGLPGIAYGTAQWVDADSDGDLDVFLSGASAQGFVSEVYRNDGGTFTALGAGLPGFTYSQADWADYDNDGDPDLVLSGGRLGLHLARGATTVYRNDGGTFTALPLDLPQLFSGGVAWGDFDGDGRADLLLNGVAQILDEEKTGYVFRNEGEDRFARMSGVVFYGSILGSLAVGDLDRDHDLDFIGIGRTRRIQTIPYRNEYDHENTPPEPPSALQATVHDDDRVTLTWQATTDAETPSAGLTYNLRVGTAPGRADVTAPMADLATGRRRLSAPGNVRQNTAWTLQGLPAGTYYWSVQALDHSLTGSGFAPEHTFTIGDHTAHN